MKWLISLIIKNIIISMFNTVITLGFKLLIISQMFFISVYCLGQHYSASWCSLAQKEEMYLAILTAKVRRLYWVPLSALNNTCLFGDCLYLRHKWNPSCRFTLYIFHLLTPRSCCSCGQLIEIWYDYNLFPKNLECGLSEGRHLCRCLDLIMWLQNLWVARFSGLYELGSRYGRSTNKRIRKQMFKTSCWASQALV